MLSETEFKIDLISALNKNNPDWVDGDIENQHEKTADIVNHLLMIAIEIKDDTKSELPKHDDSSSYGSYNVVELNRRFFDHIKNANRKFRAYLNYQTILLLRTNLPDALMVRSAIEGIHTFERSPGGQSSMPFDGIMSPRLTYVGRRGEHRRQEIGCFLVLNGDKYSYFPNGCATSNRAITKPFLESFFGFNILEI